MTKDQNITLIKSLLRTHSAVIKLWHDASFNERHDYERAADLADDLAALERDITYIASDIFGEDN